MKQPPHIDYADIDGVVVFDVRGVLAQNQKEAEDLIETEVMVSLGKALSEGDGIQIYWNLSGPTKDYPFHGDAKAIVLFHSGNRKPKTFRGSDQ